MPEFLSDALKSRRVVRVFTTNGFQMVGRIIQVDTDFRSIVLDIDGKEHFVFMSAISTIA